MPQITSNINLLSPHKTNCRMILICLPYPLSGQSHVFRLFIRWILCNIITLVVLWALSQSREGLLTINLQHKDVLFVWHFVPTAIATANNLGFSAIGSALLICQPYLNLLWECGTSTKESLTLDYSELLPRVAFMAIRQRHWVAFFFSTSML